MTRRRRPALLPLLLALAACSPGLSGHVPLRLIYQSAAPADPREELHELLLETPRGDTIRAVLRRPARPLREGASLPAIVLLAGRETGRQAAAVIPGPIETVVLAVEYPEVIPATARLSGVLSNLPSIRREAYRVPGVLRGAAYFLASQSWVDSTRIGLVGVSFGVPFAAAAATDSIFCCVALHHGGADLSLLLRTTLRIDNRLFRAAAAEFGAWYLRKLEPARHVGDISPRSLLLINGLHDELVPRRSAMLLRFHARPPVRQIWLPHDHLMPEELGVMRELADSTLSAFPQLVGGEVKR